MVRTALSTPVLVVEDNEDARCSMVELLETFGYSVIAAADGSEGLAAARKSRPFAIVTDIGMPVMNGHELAAAVRADEELKDTFIIAISGWGREHESRTADTFNLRLVKPADIADIAGALTEAFCASNGRSG